MNGVPGEEPQGADGVAPAPTRDTPFLTWRVIGGTAPGGTSRTSRRMLIIDLCRGCCFSCSTDKKLSRMGLGIRNKSPREFYGQCLLMKFALNDFWTPRSTGKSHNLKDRIRG